MAKLVSLYIVLLKFQKTVKDIEDLLYLNAEKPILDYR